MRKTGTAIRSVTVGIWIVGFALAINAQSVWGKVKVQRSIQVHGHRGARALRPENTLSAFKKALEVGVDFLEMDLGITQDKVLVVTHDSYINPRICLDPDRKRIAKNKKIRVYDLPLSELKKYDCGTLQNPMFPKQITRPGEEIPTLEEVFKFVLLSELPGARTVQFNIETKTDELHPEAPSPDEFVDLLLALIDKYALFDRVIVQSFDFRTLVKMKEKKSDVRLSALFEGAPHSGYLAQAQAMQVKVVSPRFDQISRSEIKNLHTHGIEVVPWTLNKKNWWRLALWKGVDGIITDDPEGLIKFLSK